MAIASLVLGIVGIASSLFFGMGWLGAILGILAVIFSVNGKKKEPELQNICVAGLVMGIVSIAFGFIGLIACVSCAAVIGALI